MPCRAADSVSDRRHRRDPDKEGFSGMKWTLRELVSGGGDAGTATTPKAGSNTPSPATESVNPIESNGEEDGRRGKVNWRNYELALMMRGALLWCLFDNTEKWYAERTGRVADRGRTATRPFCSY